MFMYTNRGMNDCRLPRVTWIFVHAQMVVVVVVVRMYKSVAIAEVFHTGIYNS